MVIKPAPLANIAHGLKTNTLDLVAYVREVLDHIEAVEPQIEALLPEPGRGDRLPAEADALQRRYPDPATRPPLYGVLVGVKDIYRVDGFATGAGSNLPATLFDGPEAVSVTALREAGALILGKTVTTEFACFAPGPTRNPHNLSHTPGGSSSGSAAAVAAGFCPLALGTQTIGSVIRPAAYCGIVGFKPSYNRIDPAGLIFVSHSLDHAGLFTQDVAGMKQAAAVLCREWQAEIAGAMPDRRPVLGVPDGPYPALADRTGQQAFRTHLARLEQAGYTIEWVPMFEDFETIEYYHRRLMMAEMAQVHADWFARHEAAYRPQTVQLIRDGQTVSQVEVNTARRGQGELRAKVERLMTSTGVDLWVSPPAPGAAPAGIEATGNPVMNLPWTNIGVPVVSVPAGQAENGLPLGLQLAGRLMQDEQLLAWAEPIAAALGSDEI